MPKIFKKLVLIFLISILFINSIVLPISKVKAQGVVDQQNDIYKLWNHKWYSEMDFLAWYVKVYDPDTPESEIFGERYTAAQVQWVIYSVISNLFINIFPTNPNTLVCIYQGDLNQCLDAMYQSINVLTFNKTHNYSFSEVLKSNPISGISYISSVTSKFKIVNEVQAQSSGFGYRTAAASLIPVWSVVRNLSYGIMVIIVILMSFMIMFQVKISPQLVISVQSAIPKIIISLILITFSYAIAGFVIDLMYVLIALVSLFLTESGLTQFDFVSMFNALTISDALTVVYEYWGTFSNAAWSLTKQDAKLGILAGILAILSIVSITINAVKIIIMVIKNYALLALTIISGPIEIMIGTLSNNGGFGSWLKKIVGYVIFYPVLGLMFFLTYFALYQGGSTITLHSDTAFQPTVNFIPASSWSPPFSAFDAAAGFQLMWIVISYVIFTEIPKTAELVQGLLTGKGAGFGSGLSEVNGTIQKYALDPAAKAAPTMLKNLGTNTINVIRYLASRF